MSVVASTGTSSSSDGNNPHNLNIEHANSDDATSVIQGVPVVDDPEDPDEGNFPPPPPPPPQAQRKRNDGSVQSRLADPNARALVIRDPQPQPEDNIEGVQQNAVNEVQPPLVNPGQRAIVLRQPRLIPRGNQNQLHMADRHVTTRVLRSQVPRPNSGSNMPLHLAAQSSSAMLLSPPVRRPDVGSSLQLRLAEPERLPPQQQALTFQGEPINNALQIVPQQPQLPLQAIDYRRIAASYQHICVVCGGRFFNMRALCGHMRVHKNRGWRGLKPPPGLSLPPRQGTIPSLPPNPKLNYHPGGYNPISFNPRGVTILAGARGGGGYQARPLALQWHPPQYNHQMPTSGMASGSAGVGTSGGGGPQRNEGREAGRDPGKRLALPAPPLEQRRSKRRRGPRPVPDLNSPPPQDDSSEERE